MLEIIGRFHPVLVHLPIGILLLACLFQWLLAIEKYAPLQRAIGIALFIGMFSAIASCISGYFLSTSGDYDSQLVNRHQWLGISVAIISIFFYVLHYKNALLKLQWWLATVLFLLITITGHLGGSLTHGEDYLTQLFKNSKVKQSEVIKHAIPNVQEAVVYTDIVQPLLQSKCYSCHGASKQKGRLRMDEPEALMKGGKTAMAITAGNVHESELIKRLLLPREEEKHMPPKEKSQLTENEIALLHWWIASGASFDKKIKEISQTDKVKPILLALQKPVIEKKEVSNIPQLPVEKADEAAINKLKSKGIVIMPVSINSNYLLANFVAANAITNKEVELLLPIKKQLIWLKLGTTKITDDAMPIIAQCTSLIKLQLPNTGITDKGLAKLVTLTNLQSLNVVGTSATAKGIIQLKALKKLQSIFLYQTKVEKQEWENVKKNFPNAQLDSGGYQVPLFESDTAMVVPPKRVE